MTSTEFIEERQNWLDKLSKDEYWKLIEHDGDYYYYYQSKWNELDKLLRDTPIESRVKFYKNKIVAEQGIFCPNCDNIMINMEQGTEWTGGIFTWKSKYMIEECKHCGYRLKW